MTTVAVAVNTGRGSGSKRATRWAVENLLLQADRFVLVHVMPVITHIPTPSGDRIPINDLDAKIVAKYMEDARERAQEVFYQYKKLCKPIQLEIETMLLEHDDIAEALVGYIKQFGIRSFVMGSESRSRFWRKNKGSGIPQIVLRNSPETCDIFIISKRRVRTKTTSSLASNAAMVINEQMPLTPTDNKLHLPVVLTTGDTPFHSFSSYETRSGPLSSTESFSRTNNSNSIARDESDNVNDQDQDIGSYSSGTTCSNTEVPSSNEQFDLNNEVELRLELQAALVLYNRACEDLVRAQKKVRMLSSECLEEAEKINAATEREETLRKIAEQQKQKHLQAVKEVEAAKYLLAKECDERQKAELIALKEFKERQLIVESFISSERGTRKYTPDEIKEATDFFSESRIIGEGSYGKVYKGLLDHTPVAIKVLQHDANDKKLEFVKEIEILRQLRHPNIVLLLGICPDMGCLVYEYMENGNLEEHIFRHNGKPALPWFARFRIAFEIACGLAFLHSKKPEPIVHRDIKPSNILLGRNHIAKISDVGLAKLISDNVPDTITMFGNSLLAGTLYYIDPEYQRTGTVRPKSDLYSFGVVLLQLLTARHPNGLLLIVENAVASGSLPYILDDSIKDWPLTETKELTILALDCCKLRCRDRPDLETEVLPILKKLADVADARMRVERNSIFAPSHYFCPILHEVMEDPYVAADGFTYERRAIEAWLSRHSVSPVTKKKLEHSNLTPNTTLLTGIQEWKSCIVSKGS